MFLFIVLINLIGFSDQDKQLGRIITKPLNKSKPLANIHMKFVDDLTVEESLKLNTQLLIQTLTSLGHLNIETGQSTYYLTVKARSSPYWKTFRSMLMITR